MVLKLHVKLAPVNFDPMQEIGPKVEGGRSFVSRPFFMRLRYINKPHALASWYHNCWIQQMVLVINGKCGGPGNEALGMRLPRWLLEHLFVSLAGFFPFIYTHMAFLAAEQH